jgi:glycosyltransferase involved in cell wall biosynthesis
MREIRTALEAQFEVSIFRLHNLLETRAVLDLTGAATQWSRSLLRGRPLPLQTVLYSGTKEIRSLVKALRAGEFQAIYVDSVRSQILIRMLRAELPNARIVVDFDDLMSRRMQLLSEGRITLSLGFLQHSVPRALRWSIEGPLSRLLVRYEASALAHAEQELAKSVQAVVLVSSAERDLFRHRLASELRDSVHALPPPAASYRQATRVSAPYRFVFIGSDRLAQNRLSIDLLLQLWRQLSPATELHLYGRQQRHDQVLPNVHWHGFVEDASEAYASGSILLLPVVLAGGIKTKVIEAWSFGCPVLGNRLAFEGLDVTDYPLICQESGWGRYLLDPAAHAEEWNSAAQIGNAFVRSALSREHFGIKWRSLMIPEKRESQGIPRALRKPHDIQV